MRVTTQGYWTGNVVTFSDSSGLMRTIEGVPEGLRRMKTGPITVAFECQEPADQKSDREASLWKEVVAAYVRSDNAVSLERAAVWADSVVRSAKERGYL